MRPQPALVSAPVHSQHPLDAKTILFSNRRLIFSCLMRSAGDRSAKTPFVMTCSRILSCVFCIAIDWSTLKSPFCWLECCCLNSFQQQQTFKASSINRRSLFCFSRCDAGSLRFTLSPRGSQDQRGGHCLCRFTCAPFGSLPDGRKTAERELYFFFPWFTPDGVQTAQRFGASLRFFSRRSSVR